jgi:putative ABC transport system ATP-binding protein
MKSPNSGTLEAPGLSGTPLEVVSPPAAAPAAALVHASKVYGLRQAGGRANPEQPTVTALNDVTIEFAQRRFASLMGPSGSGKSTLLHCVAGLDELSSGAAFIGGVEVSTLSDRERCALRCTEVGFVFQAFNLVPTLSATENITLPLDLARRPVERDWFEEVVTAVGMWERRHHRPNELSGGQQQRVAVARALLARPAVIFADEPTGNLDSHSGHDVLELLRRSVDEFAQSVVMVSHDAGAAAVSDEVMFMVDGRLDSRLERPSRSGILDHLAHRAPRASEAGDRRSIHTGRG